VVGTGTAEFFAEGIPGSVVSPFEFDVRSGPSGENPTGQVLFSNLESTPASVTCLSVRVVGTSPPFFRATMNLVSANFGLVTLQVSDGDPEGLPDFIAALTFSPRAPSDCSPLPFGEDNVQAIVLTGEIDIVDALPLASREQCVNGGYRSYGFRNQGECIAFVVHG
jgi:hypothetical protein